MATGRQRKQTREELRVLLLDTGRAILQEEGLGTGAEALTFKRVFDRVEKETGVRLTNASIIRRVWDNQAEFQADVLVSIATDDGSAEIEYTEAAIAQFLEELDVSSPEGRWRSAAELCRVAGAARTGAPAAPCASPRPGMACAVSPAPRWPGSRPPNSGRSSPLTRRWPS